MAPKAVVHKKDIQYTCGINFHGGGDEGNRVTKENCLKKSPKEE